MFDNNMESGAPAGAQAQPGPAPSSGGAQPPSPVDAKTVETILTRLERIEQGLRGSQSAKDKGIVKVARRVEAMEEQFTRYEQLRAAGLQPVQAQREMKLDALLAQMDDGATDLGSPGSAGLAPNAPATNVDMAQTLELLQLKSEDPEVTDLVRQGAGLEGFFSLALKRRQTSVVPNAAAVLPTGSFSPQPGDTMETRAAELERLTKLGAARTVAQDQAHRKLMLQLAQEVRG